MTTFLVSAQTKWHFFYLFQKRLQCLTLPVQANVMLSLMNSMSCLIMHYIQPKPGKFYFKTSHIKIIDEQMLLFFLLLLLFSFFISFFSPKNMKWNYSDSGPWCQFTVYFQQSCQSTVVESIVKYYPLLTTRLSKSMLSFVKMYDQNVYLILAQFLWSSLLSFLKANVACRKRVRAKKKAHIGPNDKGSIKHRRKEAVSSQVETDTFHCKLSTCRVWEFYLIKGVWRHQRQQMMATWIMSRWTLQTSW